MDWNLFTLPMRWQATTFFLHPGVVNAPRTTAQMFPFSKLNQMQITDWCAELNFDPDLMLGNRFIPEELSDDIVIQALTGVGDILNDEMAEEVVLVETDDASVGLSTGGIGWDMALDGGEVVCWTRLMAAPLGWVQMRQLADAMVNWGPWRALKCQLTSPGNRIYQANWIWRCAIWCLGWRCYQIWGRRDCSKVWEAWETRLGREAILRTKFRLFPNL